ncbi:zonadhesin (predicted), isoform CRA_a [Rattus norvegicus]|uniref:Zonadhesin (Predicted), isoform CRA_a n=1 Tax=Rattus norvegicus TaxID=10116 RepID=A6J028_RAT|nr:zonadhesin (predicted), isoform CRA_a [Rattus norvegicus]EDM13268.1 zonadhesin (predicted), isoform CRA_a [Rattus norvegicus]
MDHVGPGEEWFSPNCTERCRCLPGSLMECQISQCGTHTICQLKSGQYQCEPYGGATCLVYGDLHFVTFDERHIGFTGTCTYILTETCSNSTDPFFRITASTQERGVDGVSSLGKVFITLQEMTITMDRGRHTLIGDQEVTLPAIPSDGIYVGLSGRFVELKTTFGLRVRWDGDQQLFVTVSSTYSGKLCGFCGNYDGDSSNDNLKSDGMMAYDSEELGQSWQVEKEEDEDWVSSRCLKKKIPPSCDPALVTTMLGPELCGQLVNPSGPFEACLLHLKASSFLDNCVTDMCSFQGLQQKLCAHMSAMTATCQDAGYPVKAWRGPEMCPLVCPKNSRYSLCANPCPDTCHPGSATQTCSDDCVEACECSPGFILSGFECVPASECGCISLQGRYFKVQEQWFNPDCKEICICESHNNIRCKPWKCKAQETCGHKNGILGCHAQGTATCIASGDPHYLTFDGALHHFMGTCTYVLTQPCWPKSQDNNFVVSATNEIRGGNMEVSYVKAVHVQVFDLKISLFKGQKVMVNNQRVVLPVWPSKGRVTIRMSGIFVLLYTNFGLQVRYDGRHLVEVTVPSSYTGSLCGLCGNYNNNSLDDNLRADMKPAVNSLLLGAAWKILEASDPGCFIVGVKASSCQESNVDDTWTRKCAVLMNPVALECPAHSHYTNCLPSCLPSCLDPDSRCEGSGHKVPATCKEGCICQPDYVLNNDKCVLKSQCGCRDGKGVFTPAGKTWISEDCTQSCTCVKGTLRCRDFHCPSGTYCRNSTCVKIFLQCPAHSQFTDCLPPCHPSCSDPEGHCEGINTKGPSHCKEGCVCQSGYVLQDDKCVLKIECGCRDTQGGFILAGKNWTSRGCTQSCNCMEGVVRCQHFQCPSGTYCQDIADGTSNCATLQCPAHSSFTNCLPSCLPSCLDPEGHCEGFTTKGPFACKEGCVCEPGYVLLDDKCVPRIECGGCKDAQGVLISADKTWINKGCTQICTCVTGTIHCTNFQCPLGTYCKDIEDGNTNCTKISLQCPPHSLYTHCLPSCLPSCSDPEGLCGGTSQKAASTCREGCVCEPGYVLRNDKCVLKIECDCEDAHGVLIPADTIWINRGCTQTCTCMGGAIQCQNFKCPLDTYCKDIEDGNSNCTNIELHCPAHSHYSNCLPHCQPSCSDPDGHCEGSSTKAPSTCREGCVCEPDYVLNGNKCVLRIECGCKDTQGVLILEDTTWINRGCTRSCTCVGGAIQCQKHHCPSGTYCKDAEGDSSSCAPITLQCPAHSSFTNCLPSCLPSCSDPEGHCEGSTTKGPFACKEGCVCEPGYVLLDDKCVPRIECGGCKDAQGVLIPLCSAPPTAASPTASLPASLPALT